MPDLVLIKWAFGCLLLMPVLLAIQRKLRTHRYAVVNPSPSWDIFELTSMLDFVRRGKDRVSEGLDKFKGRPFILNTDVRPRIILSSEYIDHVNAAPNLDFNSYLRAEFCAYLPSFKFFDAPGHLIEDMVRVKLTQNLAKFTVPLSDEADIALRDLWGDSTEWHERVLKPDLLTLISRLSAVIFTGGELARNEEWQKLTIEVTVNGFLGALECRSFPKPLQYLVQLFMPHATKSRRNLARGQVLVGEVIARRQREQAEAAKEGGEPRKYNDAIAWIEELSATGKYPPADPAVVQISLAMTAIHTSTDLLTESMYKMCAHPEVLPVLREEIATVIGQLGWTKQALSELRHLDSLLKETQRLTGGGLVMSRVALADVHLPNHVTIKKGEQMAISSHLMLDPQYYSEPEKFDPFRYVKRRKDPALANKSHLVSTSLDHTGFSHGKHACPVSLQIGHVAQVQEGIPSDAFPGALSCCQ